MFNIYQVAINFNSWNWPEIYNDRRKTLDKTVRIQKPTLNLENKKIDELIVTKPKFSYRKAIERQNLHSRLIQQEVQALRISIEPILSGEKSELVMDDVHLYAQIQVVNE
mgnify:CR=1 FL=1